MATPRLRYQTLEFANADIHIRTLRDNQQFHDPDGHAEALGISSANWSLFGVVWPAGQVLARFIDDYPHQNKRILELGCGIGLASLLLNQQDADITATDYHPEAQGFLQANTELNGNPDIPFVRTDWNDEESELGRFDLIIGSDVLYETGHIEQLLGFIDQHANYHCDVVLVDPGRGNHAKFSRGMVAAGYSHQQHKPDYNEHLDKEFKGQILQYQR